MKIIICYVCWSYWSFIKISGNNKRWFSFSPFVFVFSNVKIIKCFCMHEWVCLSFRLLCVGISWISSPIPKQSVTWYATEREKVRLISPTLCVWTNKSQDWPLKGRYERKSNYSHSMICNESRSEWKPRAACTPWSLPSWMERRMWVIVVAWPNDVEKEEPNDWPNL